MKVTAQSTCWISICCRYKYNLVSTCISCLHFVSHASSSRGLYTLLFFCENFNQIFSYGGRLLFEGSLCLFIPALGTTLKLEHHSNLPYLKFPRSSTTEYRAHPLDTTPTLLACKLTKICTDSIVYRGYSATSGTCHSAFGIDV